MEATVKRRKRKRKTAIIRSEVVLIDRKCLCCGATANLTLDHVLPRRYGGATSLINSQTLCERCNHEKADNYIDYRPVKPPVHLLRTNLTPDKQILADRWVKKNLKAG